MVALAAITLACTTPQKSGPSAEAAASTSLVAATADDPAAVELTDRLTPAKGQHAQEAPPSSAAPAAPTRTTLPRFAGGEMPQYPRMSRRNGEEGWVEIAIDVQHDGEVVALAISDSSGSPRLEAAALAAARTWRFQARTGNRGVDRLSHRVVFKLTRE